MKAILFTVTFSATIRDLIHSGTIKAVSKNRRVIIATSIYQTEIERYVEEEGLENVKVVAIRPFTLNLPARILRYLLRGLLSSRSKTIRYGNVGGVRLPQRIANYLMWLPSFLGLFNVLYRFISYLIYLFTRNRIPEYINNLTLDVGSVYLTRMVNFSPDFIFYVWAVKNKKKVSLIISSWDNISGKGVYTFGMDKFYCWNSKMTEDLLRYSNLKANEVKEKCVIYGIPRFDSYFKLKEKFSPDDSKSLLGIKEEKLILYTTGSSAIGRYRKEDRTIEFDYLDSIIASLCEGEFGQEYLLIIRLHPQASVKAYNKFYESTPNVKLYIPGEEYVGENDRLFNSKENEILFHQLNAATVVINVASTMSLDALAVGSRVLCISDDLEKDIQQRVSNYYKFEHFEHLLSHGVLEVCSDINQIMDYIKEMDYSLELDSMLLRKLFYRLDGFSWRRLSDEILLTNES